MGGGGEGKYRQPGHRWVIEEGDSSGVRKFYGWVGTDQEITGSSMFHQKSKESHLQRTIKGLHCIKNKINDFSKEKLELDTAS
jgi:hypothetical protein